MLRGIKKYITIILISLIFILLFASNKSKASTLGLSSMFNENIIENNETKENNNMLLSNNILYNIAPKANTIFSATPRAAQFNLINLQFKQKNNKSKPKNKNWC